jgi:hypothetical protein
MTSDRAESSVGGRHAYRPHRPRLSLSRRHHRLGEPCGSGVAYLQLPALDDALARYAGGRSSAPIRIANVPVRPSPARWRAQGSRSPRRAGVVRWTASSSSGCGSCSSMRTSISRADGREAKAGVASWIAFYNDRRLHQAHVLSCADGGLARTDAGRERCRNNADALTTCPQQLRQTESRWQRVSHSN